MGDDDGTECGGVVVPVSLIRDLTEGVIQIIDRWHEEREIQDLDMSVCLVALMATVDALSQMMIGCTEGETMQ